MENREIIFRAWHEESKVRLHEYLANDSRRKIIGNIYENPELSEKRIK